MMRIREKFGFTVILSLSVFLLIFGAAEGGGNVGGSKVHVNLTGDIMLGALFPIHRRGSGSETTCDRIQVMYIHGCLT
jgi:hypothetical protein